MDDKYDIEYSIACDEIDNNNDIKLSISISSTGSLQSNSEVIIPF